MGKVERVRARVPLSPVTQTQRTLLNDAEEEKERGRCPDACSSRSPVSLKVHARRGKKKNSTRPGRLSHFLARAHAVSHSSLNLYINTLTTDGKKEPLLRFRARQRRLAQTQRP